MKRIVSAVSVVALMTAGTVLLFDVAAYFTLPYRMTAAFPEYRSTATDAFGGRGHYPFNYFAPHPERGFDIGVKRSATHTVDDLTYPIWSNSLACFDQEHTDFSSYLYLLGDSYTWGYATYEDKFGTLLEEASGKVVLKCGVTHTGQRHQLHKMHEIAETVGAHPAALLVVWYQNDIANDFFFPHSSVVDGWQVDRVFINRDGDRVTLSDAELVDGVSRRIARLKKKSRGGLGKTVRRYSITANLIDVGLKSLSQKQTTAAAVVPERRSIYQIDTGTGGQISYRQNRYAVPNQQALIAIRDYAGSRQIPVAVVLVPPREHVSDVQYHLEVREFLSKSKIHYVDLAEVYAEEHIKADDVFWLDGHFNIAGNAHFAQVISSRFPELVK